MIDAPNILETLRQAKLFKAALQTCFYDPSIPAIRYCYMHYI